MRAKYLAESGKQAPWRKRRRRSKPQARMHQSRLVPARAPPIDQAPCPRFHIEQLRSRARRRPVPSATAGRPNRRVNLAFRVPCGPNPIFPGADLSALACTGEVRAGMRDSRGVVVVSTRTGRRSPAPRPPAREGPAISLPQSLDDAQAEGIAAGRLFFGNASHTVSKSLPCTLHAVVAHALSCAGSAVGQRGGGECCALKRPAGRARPSSPHGRSAAETRLARQGPELRKGRGQLASKFFFRYMCRDLPMPVLSNRWFRYLATLRGIPALNQLPRALDVALPGFASCRCLFARRHPGPRL